MAAYYRTKGISMMQARENLYQKYGVYVHAQHSFTFEGESGMIRMQNIMEHLRIHRPEQIDNLKVIQFADHHTAEVERSLVHTGTGCKGYHPSIWYRAED